MANKLENPRIRDYIWQMFLKNPLLTSRAVLAHFSNRQSLTTVRLPNRLKITGDLADGYFAALAMGKYLEPEIDEYIIASLSNGDTFIDIGANIGIKTAAGFRQVGEQGRVIAIEPTPRTYEILSRNAQRWSPTAIIALNIAVSDTRGITQLKDFGPSKAGLNTLNERPRSSSTPKHTLVSTFHMTLDSLDQNPAAIKIDAEGSEYKILLGFQDTLRKTGPNVIFETGNPDTPEAFGLLERLGYAFFALSPGGKIEKITKPDHGRYLNVLASKRINH